MFGRRDSSDTRTKREKLEAMANQTASPNEAAIAKRKLADIDKNPSHPLFKRRSSDPLRGTTPKEREQQWTPPNTWKCPNCDKRFGTHGELIGHQKAVHDKQPPRPVRPHEYAAYGGSDAMGCRVCGRSWDNKSANHTNVEERMKKQREDDEARKARRESKQRYQDTTKEEDREHDKKQREAMVDKWQRGGSKCPSTKDGMHCDKERGHSGFHHRSRPPRPGYASESDSWT